MSGNKMTRREMLRLAALGAAGAVVAACAPTATEAPEVVEAPEVPAVEAEQITLRITDWQAGTVNLTDSYAQMMPLFEEAHPGVKIDYQQYTAGTYEEYLMPAIASGDAPDVFAVYPGGPLAILVETGGGENLVPISDIMDEEWASWLGKAANFNGAIVDGKLWVAPQDAQTECVWIYKDMLEASGMEAPSLGVGATVDEVIDLVEPATQQGWDVFAAGFLEPWVVHGWFFNMIHQLQPSDTPDMAMQALNGEISWQQDVFALPIEAFKKMQDAHVWREDSINMDYQTQATAKWTEKKAIGLFANGDWWAGSCVPEENNPDNPNVATFMYPLVNKDVTPAYNWGFGSDFGINAKGEHQELATEFVRYTNSPEAAKIFVKNSVNPAAAGALDISEIPETDNPIFNECIKLFSSVDGRSSEYFYTQAEGLDAIYAGVVNVMIGEDTIDNVLAELDKVSGYS